MGKTTKIIIGVVVTAAVAAGVGFFAKCRFGGSCGLKSQALSQERKFSLATELVRIVREEPDSALRQWLVSQTPWVSGQAIMSLDNTNDPGSRARLAALNAIYSLDSEGLSEEARKGWAMVLRDLANSMLHAGPSRTDYVAKSFLMEGRLADAAAAYQMIPEHPAAKLFFGSNPELRAPASR